MEHECGDYIDALGGLVWIEVHGEAPMPDAQRAEYGEYGVLVDRDGVEVTARQVRRAHTELDASEPAPEIVAAIRKVAQARRR